jgi:hypothetical protein
MLFTFMVFSPINSAIAPIWLPGCDAQIKNAAAYPEVFHAG